MFPRHHLEIEEDSSKAREAREVFVCVCVGGGGVSESKRGRDDGNDGVGILLCGG